MITIVFTDFVGPLHPDEIERQKEEMFYPGIIESLNRSVLNDALR